MNEADARKLKQAVREACLKAARDAWEDARRQGLCHEGALEAALGAIEMVDLAEISTTDD